MEFVRVLEAFSAPDVIDELREVLGLGEKALDRRLNIPAPAEAKLALSGDVEATELAGEEDWLLVSMSQNTPLRPVTAATTEALTVLRLSSMRIKSFIFVSKDCICCSVTSMQSAMIVAPVIHTLAADSWKVSD